MCTTKSLTRCHLITISRNDFHKALRAIDEKHTKDRVDFIKWIPLFSRLTSTYLGKFSSHFKYLDVTRDHILFKEGDMADKVYLIKSGEFIITKKMIHKTKTKENIADILEDPQRACKLNNKFFSKNTVRHIDNHTIALIGPRNLIGVNDTIASELENPSGKYHSQAKCISKDAQLMVMDKEDFMKLQQQSTTWGFLK